LKSILAYVIAGIWLLTIGAGNGRAQIIAQHSGASNPTTESWQFFNSGSPGTIGPVTNDQNGGVDAWSVALPSTATALTEASYIGATPKANLNAALTNGWELTARLRFPVVPQNCWFFINLNLAPLGGPTPRGYALIFYPGQSGLTYQLSSSIIDGPIQGPPAVLLPNPTDYHLFQIQYDPVSKSADLFVDGAMTVSNFVGVAYAQHSVFDWTMRSFPDFPPLPVAG